VDPVDAIEGLDWELAGKRPPGFPHTVWQLLFHLNFWMDFELKCIERGRVERQPELAEGWPEREGPADPIAWRHEVALFRTNLDQLTTLANARASTLARTVQKAVVVTVEAVLWGLVAHNSYHVGQIVQLRSALGAWPPRRAE
jgi:uncharacterized damage-inducible protein DinB